MSLEKNQKELVLDGQPGKIILTDLGRAYYTQAELTLNQVIKEYKSVLNPKLKGKNGTTHRNKRVKKD